MNVGDIINDPGFGLKSIFVGKNATLGTFLSELFIIAIYIAAFMAFIWLVWGAFQYIVAGGNKENLAKARSRITWAIVGLLLTLIAFLVAQFAAQIIIRKPGNIPLPGFTLITTAYAAPSGVDIGNEFGLGDIASLGEGLTRLVPATFSIATTLIVFYFLIGAFKLLISAGDKEAVAGARGMITHAIIGFIILMFIFLILQFLLGSLFGITSLKIIQGP